MRFNLETSKLLYEVRYQNKKSEDLYTYEQLYKDINGQYFMHFIGSKYSEYGIKAGYNNCVGREGNYYIDKDHINIWKYISNKMKESHSDEYLIIDWEQEEKEGLLWMGEISKEELPF
jgi:hypothetical protein